MGQRIWPVPVVVFLVIWGLTTHGKFSVTGDEPHYLVMAESLVADGDLDLANNYGSSPARFGPESLAVERHAWLDRQGRLRSVHDPGVALLLLPVYAVAVQIAGAVPSSALASVRMTPGLFVYSIVSLAQLTLAAVAMALLAAALAIDVPIGQTRTAVWIAALTPPLLANSFLVFPEVPALFVTCLVIWASRAGSGAPWSLPLASAAVALLPWLHRKFSLFALGLLFVLLWERRAEVRAAPRRAALAVALVGASLVAFFALSWHWWGNVAGPTSIDGVPLSLGTFARGAPGLLLDRENGLLVWAPVHLAGLVAWWRTRARTWSFAIPALLLFVPCAAHSLWWGGFAPAARFLVPLVPFLAVALAPTLADRRVVRAVLVLVVPQLVICAIGWQRPRFLWPRGDGRNRVLDAIPGIGSWLNDALPSFRTGPLDPVAVAGTVVVVTAAAVALHLAMRPPARSSGRVALYE